MAIFESIVFEKRIHPWLQSLDKSYDKNSPNVTTLKRSCHKQMQHVEVQIWIEDDRGRFYMVCQKIRTSSFIYLIASDEFMTPDGY